MRRDLQRLRDGAARAHQIAGAVTRHAIGFREREGRERALWREARDRDVRAAIDVILVDLVRDQPQPLAAGECGQRLEPGRGQHAARRIRRRRDVERDAFFCHPLAHGGDRRFGRSDAIVERNFDRGRSKRLHDAADQRPEGRQHQHLFARRRAHSDGRAERPGGAGRDEHAAGLARNLIARADLLDQRRDQRGHALRLAVAMQIRMLGFEQILHARAREGLQPGVADVQRAHGVT